MFKQQINKLERFLRDHVTLKTEVTDAVLAITRIIKLCTQILNSSLYHIKSSENIWLGDILNII